MHKEDAERSVRDDVPGHNLEHFTIDGHTETVWKLDFSSDGRFLASVSSDTYVRIWKVSAQQVHRYHVFKGHESWVRACCFYEDNSTLVTGGNDGIITLWNVPIDKQALAALAEKHLDEIE